MPKKHKKPMKKAKPRPAPAKSRRPAAPAKPLAKRSGAVARGPEPKAKLKPSAPPPKPAAKGKARKAPLPKAKSLVKTSAHQLKASSSKIKPSAFQPKPLAKAKAKSISRAKVSASPPPRAKVSVSPPPKPKASVSPPPSAKVSVNPPLKPRATVSPPPKPKASPRATEHAPEPAPSAIAPQVAPVIRLRERGPRPSLNRDTWQSLEEAAERAQRSPLSDAQRAVIRAALEAKDSLLAIGDEIQAKLCYQLCAPLLSEPTVVLSPVPADLQAQYEALSAERKPVVCLLPELSGPERSAALARVLRSGSLLVLLSPEALSAPDVQKALAKSGVGLFVVEEAQCASELSHEIRPSYAALPNVLSALGRPPVMALARVATSAVLSDAAKRLALAEPVVARAPFVPANVQLVTRLARGEPRQASLIRLLEQLEPPGLVLCASPHDVDSVYATLRDARSTITAHRYHGGMTPSDRATELLNFTLPGARGVMVAVSAFAPGSGLLGLGEPAAQAALGFGRGTGKRDLRFVVHYQSPASLEQYLREIQHAGRDGQSATCVLFHESSHRSLHEVMLAQQRFKPAHLVELGRVLEAPALEARTVTLESLALATGQSRRTTDRLTALLADAGVVTKTGGWVRAAIGASELQNACRDLGAKLDALREQDARRLAAVSAFAESPHCKLLELSRYLGVAAEAPCGRCSACNGDQLAREPALAAPSRRAVVQEFSVRPAASVEPSSAPSLSAPLTAKLTDFGAVMPRVVH
jgi:ATP-dependent DNA helicase RecQ